MYGGASAEGADEGGVRGIGECGGVGGAGGRGGLAIL